MHIINIQSWAGMNENEHTSTLGKPLILLFFLYSSGYDDMQNAQNKLLQKK